MQPFWGSYWGLCFRVQESKSMGRWGIEHRQGEDLARQSSIQAQRTPLQAVGVRALLEGGLQENKMDEGHL